MKIRLFDLHCDTPTALYDKKQSAVCFPENIERQVQVCSVWLSDGCKEPFDTYKRILKNFKDKNTLALNRIDQNKTVLLSLEGGAAFEEDISRLEDIKNDGISSVMLTWNKDNSLAGGSLSDRGLTKKGVAAIEFINKLGMALDVSHLNDKSFFAAAEKADFLFASHSNAREVFNHKRNLPDDALGIIGEKNGIIGINFYPLFLGSGSPFENIARHITHMLDLGLENSIAIGSDFDGADMDKSLFCTEDTAALYDYLLKRFSSARLVDKIFFENAYNFYKKLFDKQNVM